MIQYQILQTDIIRIVCQTVKRITNEILGVKGLKGYEGILWLYVFWLYNKNNPANLYHPRNESGATSEPIEILSLVFSHT